MCLCRSLCVLFKFVSVYACLDVVVSVCVCLSASLSVGVY